MDVCTKYGKAYIPKLADPQVPGLRAGEADGDIGFPPFHLQIAAFGDEVGADLGIEMAETDQPRDNEVIDQALNGGNANSTGESRILIGDGIGEGKGVELQFFRMGKNRLPEIGEDILGIIFLKQIGIEIALKGSDMSAHRGMADIQLLCRRLERTNPGHCQEKFYAVPIHFFIFEKPLVKI